MRYMKRTKIKLKKKEIDTILNIFELFARLAYCGCDKDTPKLIFTNGHLIIDAQDYFETAVDNAKKKKEKKENKKV